MLTVQYFFDLIKNSKYFHICGGFQDIIRNLVPDGFLGQLKIRITAEENNLCVYLLVVDILGKGDSVQDRHADIAEDRVNRMVENVINGQFSYCILI